MTFKTSLVATLGSAFAGAALMYVGLSGVSDTRTTSPETTMVELQGTSTTKPKPSAYCKKADIGKVVNYRTPSGSASYKLKCTVKSTQAWKKVTK